MSSWKFAGKVSPRYDSKFDGDDESGIPMPEPSPSGGRGFVSLPADAFESRLGYTWDLCMIIPKKTPDGALSAVKIVKRLRGAGFETYLYYSVQKDEIICKIRAPLELLAKYASDVDYNMMLDKDDLKMMIEQGSKEASVAGRHITHDPTITPYSPYEYIHGKYCADARVAYIYARPPYLDHPFSSVHRIKLMIRIIEGQHTYGCGMNISRLVATKAVKACFPFHDEQRRNTLSEGWIKTHIRPGAQPLQDIKDYLGEKIALYFAFFGHYTSWLGPLSILGLITFIDQVIEWDLDAALIPYFAIFVSFWAVLMLENWKRQESTLAMKWGMSNFEQIESDRPEFKGKMIVSFIDGSPMTYFPYQDYVVLMTVANGVVMTMVLLAIALAALFLYLKVRWADSSNSFLSSYGSYLASILLSVEIIVMNILYKSVAVWANERENHKTDTVFEDVLIVKLAVFNFVNSYVSLFYVAFVQPFVVGCSDDECLYSLCESLAIIFCVRIVSANTIELYLPRLMMLYKAKKERTGVRAGILLTEAEVQFAFSTYHEIMGPLGDMSEIAVQFGYVTMFVVVFPIAPLLAGISNFFQIRNDAQSMLFSIRRPFPRGAQDIGSWQGVFSAIAVTAVATNAALVFFTASRYHWSGENLVWGFVISQYVVFLIMAIFAALVPDVPEHVQFQLERQKFMIAKVIDQIADETPLTETEVEDEDLEMEEGDDRAPPAPFELPKAWGCC